MLKNVYPTTQNGLNVVSMQALQEGLGLQPATTLDRSYVMLDGQDPVISTRQSYVDEELRHVVELYDSGRQANRV